MELVKIAGPLILAFIMFSLGIGLSIENFKKILIQLELEIKRLILMLLMEKKWFGK